MLTEDLALLEEFRREVRDLLADTDAAFLQLERDGGDLESMHAIFRAFHTVKGNAACFGLDRVKQFAHGVETTLDEMRQGRLVTTPEAIDALLLAKDHLARLVEFCDAPAQVPLERDAMLLGLLPQTSAPDTAHDPHVLLGEAREVLTAHAEHTPELRSLLHRIDRVLGSRDEHAAVEREPAGAATGAAPASETTASQPRPDAERVLRIDERRLETFFTSVGELLQYTETFATLQRTLEHRRDVAATLREWKAAHRNFAVVVDRLQRQVLEIRQVPVRGLFQKLARLARDTARGVGKMVQIELEGAEQSIDKGCLEVLEAPLVHMIRNAVDHGIEAGAERRANGKPAEGRLRLAVAIQRESYEFVLADDGRGIDPERVREKAVQRGLLSTQEAATLPDEAAVQLVLRPGFSTAEQVTDLSGRGVGLDVVQEAVQRRRGQLRIESRPGAGTTFRLTLPRSANTMVIEAVLVEIARQPFLLPLEAVRETVELGPRMLSRLPEGGEVLTVRGRSAPYRALSRLLRLGDAVPATQAVLVRGRAGEFALGVDRAFGLSKVAVKPLRDVLVERPYLRGAAVLGDGRVALVLHVAHFD